MSSSAAMSSSPLALDVVEIENNGLNFILGHAHFIRTIDDVCNVFVAAGAGVRYGVAFNEASGDPSPDASPFPGRRVRSDGNDEALTELARRNAMALGAGHSFIAFMDGGAFPIAVLSQIKALPTVCRVHCATANPTAVVVARLGDERKVCFVIFLVVCVRVSFFHPTHTSTHTKKTRPPHPLLQHTKGILGVLDGLTPVAYEDDDDRAKRRGFLRMIGYKS
jgi:adenosine/AMP kinase